MRKIIFITMLTLCMSLVSICSYASESFPVLMYHNVCDDEALVQKDETVHITRQRLAEHFTALKNAGYNAISLEDYYLYRTKGTELPEKPVLISFDDGYISNYTVAYPMLRDYGFKAVIFVIASRMGADNIEFPHFSWAQAREMENSGLVEIESHSFTHPDFSKLTYTQTVVEMRLAKFAIEANLGKECRFFAYPYGKMNMSSTAVAKAAGYDAVLVGRDINADTDDENLYELPRYSVRGSWTAEKLMNLIAE